MKFLFCLLGSLGHICPGIGIAKALALRGHEIAFVTDSIFTDFLKQNGFQRLPRTIKDGRSFQVESWGQPLSVAMQVKHLDYAIQKFSPDVLLGNQLTLGPVIAKEIYSLPLAILGFAAYLWPASAESLLELPPNIKDRLVWRYDDMMNHYNEARKRLGLTPIQANYRETPLLGDIFLLQSVPELEGDVLSLPQKVHLIGSCLWESPTIRDEKLLEPLKESIDSKEPLIYVQPGRSFEAPSFLRCLTEALQKYPVRVFASIGRMDGEAEVFPGNFVVGSHIPQELVLPYAKGVISNGHTTSVLGALTHGVPCLLIPNGSGTDDIAEHCQQAGAAICLSLSEVTPKKMALSVEELLNSKELHKNAQSLQQSFAKVNGFENAADLLEQLAATRSPVLRRMCDSVAT